MQRDLCVGSGCGPGQCDAPVKCNPNKTKDCIDSYISCISGKSDEPGSASSCDCSKEFFHCAADRACKDPATAAR